jgi:hypothetical protein
MSWLSYVAVSNLGISNKAATSIQYYELKIKLEAHLSLFNSHGYSFYVLRL